jgi:hypothetical protein
MKDRKQENVEHDGKKWRKGRTQKGMKEQRNV